MHNNQPNKKINKQLNISNEFMICRHADGLKLMPPDAIKPIDKINTFSSNHSLAEAFKLSLSVTILNMDSIIQRINEQSAVRSGYGSINEALGKSIRSVAKPQSANMVLANNQDVIKMNKSKIVEEQVFLKNENSYHAISVKLPLYNDKNDILGLIGFGIVVGLNPLGESLKKMVELGLFNSSSHPEAYLPGKSLGNVYLSKRENEILYYLIRGYTARKLSERIKLSPRTIEQHIASIKTKLNVTSKPELIEKIMDEYFPVKS